jgi:hypothetical protein
MSKRKLLDGNTVDELEKAVELTIKTKCPEKWLLIDLETGERYTGYPDPTAGNSNWKKIRTCPTLT